MSARSLSPILLLGLSAGLASACADDDLDCSTSAPGSICTWAGSGERSFNGDERPRHEASFYWPLDLEFAPDGRAYILDWQNHRVRRVNADDRLETVMGTDAVGDGPPGGEDLRPEGAVGTTVELNHPTDLAFHPDGSLLVAAWHNHKIRRLDPATGRVTVICGSGPGQDGDGTSPLRARLNQPKAIAPDPAGNVYVADSRNQRIRLIEAGFGRINMVAGTGRQDFSGDGGDPQQATFHLQRVNENPEPGGGIALDAQGRLYVSDTFNNRIRRIDFAARTVATVAGNGVEGFGGDGGPATEAALNHPRDLEVGPDGRLYIADTDNHRIRVVDLTSGLITTVVGTGEKGFGGDGGPPRAARLYRPFGIGFDRAGQLYIADTFNNRIRRILP